VVDAFGAGHGMRGLYVADASVFPTSVAVPPQITVMALATRTAQRILGTL
jgi:choline dehydrogenase-like flavoprotein